MPAGDRPDLRRASRDPQGFLTFPGATALRAELVLRSAGLTGIVDAYVLVVDDDEILRDMIDMALRYAGFTTSVAADGREALTSVAAHRPDLVVLDVLMPNLDGFEVCRRLRRQGDRTPVIFLTARSASRDVLEGFGRGGDDYVTKPFVIDELVARIRAVLARSGSETDDRVLRCGDLVLDPDRHEVRRAGELVECSPTEFRLLAYLMANAGRVLSKAQIMERVWGFDYFGDGHVVETYVSSLRRRLHTGSGGPVIRTVRGVGYTIRPEETT
jgi:two-component system OmpR family response regulator